MNYLKKNITPILIISQIFGLYGGMLQAPRILAILFLPLLIRDLNKKLIKGKEVLLFFFSFIMYCVLSMLFLTFNNDQSLKEFAYALINFIIFIEILNFSKYLSLNKLINGWVIFVLLSIPIAIIEINFNLHFSNSKFGDDTVLGGVGTIRKYAAITFGNYNLYNHLLAISFPFILAKLKFISSKFFKILYILFILAIVWVVLTNASRGTMLCLLISTIIYIIFYSSKSISKTIIYTFISIIVSFAGYIYVMNNASFSYLKTRIEQKGLEDNSRKEMINVGIDMFINSKFLGVGAGNFSETASKMTKNPILVPHNLFIELLSQYGIVVFFTFLLLLYKIFNPKKIFKKREIPNYILLGSLLVMPLAFTINSVYLNNPYMWIWLASLYCISSFYKTIAKNVN
ncbi:O-antigen ligase [Chryseobacterium cucumeris]|uniref:O-antigen ligase family protein n=1 Tax=Chryseobacterium cucumeris TaxID=1813611 RepID=UPI00192D9DD8|nr:O-antigen ligase family protein [Chryseobacterium cucumeris]QRA42239.1 O-antigen ligase family protein [Chryseobacterium cucumeris]